MIKILFLILFNLTSILEAREISNLPLNDYYKSMFYQFGGLKEDPQQEDIRKVWYQATKTWEMPEHKMSVKISAQQLANLPETTVSLEFDYSGGLEKMQKFYDRLEILYQKNGMRRGSCSLLRGSYYYSENKNIYWQQLHVHFYPLDKETEILDIQRQLAMFQDILYLIEETFKEN